MSPILSTFLGECPHASGIYATAQNAMIMLQNSRRDVENAFFWQTTTRYAITFLAKIALLSRVKGRPSARVVVLCCAVKEMLHKLHRELIVVFLLTSVIGFTVCRTLQVCNAVSRVMKKISVGLTFFLVCLLIKLCLQLITSRNMLFV